ncbi:6-phosphogluconate dehydrogenase C-terminal domain-like protein [Aspergillus heteromorphus CBS 117.55]|uniref:6-phosphogluconate dehydrogenase C-terminal domain-like protein n=1 Tax=Aspergillus heteromorphus CBS 117.55 TaxID=1448321 RepID=A0A317WJL4_9EURO|nr:6-phosphogluconate dehydrogenase C-terminal domain-like protein [Aspergillus heteromorphus CBS 117.55]PWY86644.1 6-phosphogluconate dehydrogenase C-terminal domain-like protein [Aspergillus heteromorphus CBS 117.55]
MGLAMAMNLQTHLSQTGAPSLHFYNRTPARGQPLLSIGGTQSPSIRDLILDVDICCIAVSNGDAVTSIINSVLEVPGVDLRGKIIVDTSTISPDTSSWAQRPIAKEGKLLFILAGHEEGVTTIEPFLVGVLARKTLYVGEDAGKASLLKTTGNFLTAGFMELIAEAHVLAEKTGLGNEALESLMEHQYGPLPFAMSKRLTGGGLYLPEKGERPWSDLQLAIKDVGLGVECAEKAGTNLPIADVVLKHLEEARQYGEMNDRALDSSSMYGVLRERAGLGFESEVVKRRDGCWSR